MIRLFTGIELPLALRERLFALGAGIPNARWTGIDNLHVTLRFIGEVDEAHAHDLHDALSLVRAPAFTLTLSGVGTFETGRSPHTLWAGVERTPPLVYLRDRVEAAIVRAGEPPERRKFAPHVTLARLKNAPTGRLHEFIVGHSLLRAEFPVDSFALFSSHPGSGEPVYRVEAEYALVAAEAGGTVRSA